MILSRFHITSIILTCAWAAGFTSVVPFLYVFNTLPIIILIAFAQKIVFDKHIVFLISLLIINLLVFNTGYVFGLKLFSYLSVYIIVSSFNLRLNVKPLYLILYTTVFLFFINKLFPIFDDNFFFQRNSFPSFVFGIAALISYFEDNKPKLSLFIVVFATVLFSGTIGALLAMSAALLLSMRWKYMIPIIISLSLLMALIVISGIEISILSRFQAMYDNIFSKVSITELITNDSLTSGSFGSKGFTDTSAVFRILHWLDILRYHFDHSFLNILFGHGLDSVKYSLPLKMNKYPHNDVLRVFVELGLFFGIIFFRRIIQICRQLKGISLLYTSALLIFLFSENLLNNFISSLPLFILMGNLKINKIEDFTH